MTWKISATSSRFSGCVGPVEDGDHQHADREALRDRGEDGPGRALLEDQRPMDRRQMPVDAFEQFGRALGIRFLRFRRSGIRGFVGRPLADRLLAAPAPPRRSAPRRRRRRAVGLTAGASRRLSGGLANAAPVSDERRRRMAPPRPAVARTSRTAVPSFVSTNAPRAISCSVIVRRQRTQNLNFLAISSAQFATGLEIGRLGDSVIRRCGKFARCP